MSLAAAAVLAAGCSNGGPEPEASTSSGSATTSSIDSTSTSALAPSTAPPTAAPVADACFVGEWTSDNDATSVALAGGFDGASSIEIAGSLTLQIDGDGQARFDFEQWVIRVERVGDPSVVEGTRNGSFASAIVGGEGARLLPPYDSALDETEYSVSGEVEFQGSQWVATRAADLLRELRSGVAYSCDDAMLTFGVTGGAHWVFTRGGH